MKVLLKFLKSKTSPKGGKRACLCENNTYSSECCKGGLKNQGIGSLQGGTNDTIIQTGQVRIITN
jgi:hypothetical protein